VIADTVGFVRRLPHKLVESFKATLEEVVEAALLLHVLDASDPGMADKREEVHAVLAEMDAMSVPRLEVHNKIDRAEDPEPALLRGGDGSIQAVRVSARDRIGFDLLEEAIAARLGDAVRVTAVLGPEQGRLRARLHERGWVESEYSDSEGNQHFRLHLPAESVRRLQSEGVHIESADGSGRVVTEDSGTVLAAPSGAT
jgi:GTP-binding protein HflX